MPDIFPPGFWKVTVMASMAVFSIVGMDLLFGSRMVTWMSRTMNKKVHIDQLVVNALASLKKSSDLEFNMESTLLRGAGRIVASGILFLCVYLMFAFLLPKLT